MRTYFVQSGNLKITIIADTAYEAALEAVKWWDDDSTTSPDAEHRANLDPAIEVRPTETSRISRRFPTFNLLARAAGESPAQAWERLLRDRTGQSN